MEKENLIRPSLLSADFLHLEKDIEEMISLGITHCHFDVMDGCFVSDISFGKTIFDAVKKYQDRIIFDVHLMTVSPFNQVYNFAHYGAKEITFHYEAMSVGDMIAINNFKKQYPDVILGIAISPETKVDEIEKILPLFDSVLVMSVIPGKGGQSYIEGSEKKIARLAKLRKEQSLSYTIGVDGGINATTCKLVVEAGVDYAVAGSYYFKSTDKKACLASLHEENKVL